jgi:hypothetical protein
MKLRTIILAFVTLALAVTAGTVLAQKSAKKKQEKGWVKLFDGKTLNGWKISEPEKNSWKVENGAIVANGPRSHLFYVADPKPFKDFELKAEVMTKPGSNGGIYFHTQPLDVGWPKYGFEVQVNQSHTDWKRTGSLYDVVNVKENFAKDDEWYTYDIIVKGKHVTIKVNDKVAVDWEQPADREPGKDFPRMLGEGTFALQAHDPKSVVYYRNLMVRRLD